MKNTILSEQGRQAGINADSPPASPSSSYGLACSNSSPYEADSITPFVANSPLMSFFYDMPQDYQAHLTHEGELNLAARAWQQANNTYGFSNGLGVVEVAIALLVLANPFSKWLGLLGGVLSFCTPLVTLTF